MKDAKRKAILILPLFLGIFLLFSLPGFGADQPDFPNIYIDEGCAGTHVGSQANPYDDLSDINWTTGGDNSIFDYLAGSPSQSPTIYLKKGDEWRAALNVGCSGTVTYPIIITSYGSGLDPIINGADLITPGTSWTQDVGGESSCWSHVLDSDVTHANDNKRTIITATEISGTGDEIRIQAEANSGSDTVLSGTSIGQRDGSTDDFASAPTRITWDSGNNGCTISAGTTKWSDWVTFAMDDTKDHLIHWYYSGGSMVYRYDYASNRGYTAQVGSDNTLTQTVSYNVQHAIHIVVDIEVRSATANVWKATSSGMPVAVWFDDTNIGHKESVKAGCNTTYDWFHDGATTLYVYATSDPDTLYTSPGIETAERGCIDVDPEDYINIQNLNCKHGAYWNIYFANGASNCTVDGCTSQYAGYHGIGENDPDGPSIDSLTIKNCIVHHNGGAGIFPGRSATNWTIQNNTVYNNAASDESGIGGSASGINLGNGAGCGGHLIENNTVYNTGVDSSIVGNGVGIWLDIVEGSACIVRYNISYNNGLHGIELEKTSNCELYYNITYGNGDDGIYVVGRSGYQTDSNEIYNNVSYGNTGDGIVADGDGSGSDVFSDNIFKNNISVGNGVREFHAALGGANDGTNGSGNIYTYNCFGAEATGFIRWLGSNYNTYAAWESAYGSSTYSAEADPLLTNPTTDFTLQSNSPCIDAGVNVGLSLDYAGNVVPQGVGVDIGAYEYEPDLGIIAIDASGRIIFVKKHEILRSIGRMLIMMDGRILIRIN